MGSDLTNEIDADELSGEERFEMEAAFGKDAVENGDVVRIDTDKLERAGTPEYRLKDVLEQGDWLTIQHKGGNVTTGPVEDVTAIAVTIDPRNRTTGGYFGFGDFVCEGTGERGVVNELLDINGEPAERVIGRREDA